jgi:hypothetical protein
VCVVCVSCVCSLCSVCTVLCVWCSLLSDRGLLYPAPPRPHAPAVLWRAAQPVLPPRHNRVQRQHHNREQPRPRGVSCLQRKQGGRGLPHFRFHLPLRVSWWCGCTYPNSMQCVRDVVQPRWPCGEEAGVHTCLCAHTVWQSGGWALSLWLSPEAAISSHGMGCCGCDVCWMPQTQSMAWRAELRHVSLGHDQCVRGCRGHGLPLYSFVPSPCALPVALVTLHRLIAPFCATCAGWLDVFEAAT